jgi:hypothetical protein
MMDVAFDVHWSQKTGVTSSINETVESKCHTTCALVYSYDN